jgi:outer membrane biogenesis lipoprotein LolB
MRTSRQLFLDVAAVLLLACAAVGEAQTSDTEFVAHEWAHSLPSQAATVLPSSGSR